MSAVSNTSSVSPLGSTVSTSADANLSTDRSARKLVRVLITISVLSAAVLVGSLFHRLNRGAPLDSAVLHDDGRPVRAGESTTNGSMVRPTNAMLDREPIQLPEFKLIDSTDAPVDMKRFLGRPSCWCFFYTTCPGMCVTVSQTMKRVRAELPGDVLTVNLTVDPKTDRPEALRAYAANLQADSSTWMFLTGERSDVINLVRAGFKLPLEENVNPKEDEEPITHSPLIALVDKKGRVRGLYDARNAASIDDLKKRVEKLRAE
jgi:protein SCO1/2